MDDLVEGSAIGAENWGQGSVRRITQGKHVGAVALGGYPEDTPAGFLIADRRVAGT
jgi:hypothetical protein